ncbi:S1 family peptidase [Fusibacter ferrireducens]|uniref:Trypsin-like peptidase domain-containing protein n=1 Tax=Fusibacter ferrireducens TaxID=2785058 RepID=A0ABR9ZRM7_9FIRM|nr:serine protease [Fusibacter ferrireducens]MBF4693113.1 trypsin-like peptidase domain-containing protein [Fusibacter ferrireducens]
MERKKFLAAIIAMCVLIVFLLVMGSSIKEQFNNQVYKTLIAKVRNEALPANIEIIESVESKSDNVTGTSFSTGFSGVIIGNEGDTYYALTAKHAILEENDSEDTEYIIIGYDALDMKTFLNSGEKYIGSTEYYQPFPKAEIVYSNDSYDLVLIRFTSEAEYLALPIASEPPKAGETIASMSNPNGEHNEITIGKIKRGERVRFNDDAGKNQYPMMTHTAFCDQGSSGGALLNQNLEIVGIELGGNENTFRRFISGMMMPSDRILEFLEASGYEIKN